MKVNGISKEIHKHAPTILLPKKNVDATGFQAVLDAELDKLNNSGSIYMIEQPKLVLAGILGVVNGVKSLIDDCPKMEEEVKAFGFDKIQKLIEEALQQTVIGTGRGQTR